MLKFLIVAAGLALGSAGFAQTPVSPATQQVQLLAPQLVVFSGSIGNLDSLVTGLTTGGPITLATVGLDGSLQIVTFVPGSAVSVTDAARLLESARQSLITRGIATPNAQQLAASLMGGTIATRSGFATLTGVLTGTTTPPTPIQVRTEPLPILESTGGSNLSASQVQAIRNALATGTGVTLQNTTFGATGVRMSDFEVTQALQLAATLLAQQGILNPTAEQLRVALFGGRLLNTNGSTVALQGILQGRVRNTSDSTQFNVSASPNVNTSASPLFGTSDTPATVRPTLGGAPNVGSAASSGASSGAGVAPRATAPGVIRPGAR